MEARIFLLLISLCGYTQLVASDKILPATATKADTQSVKQLQDLKYLCNQIIKDDFVLGNLNNTIRRNAIKESSNYLADQLCDSESIENQQRTLHYITSLASNVDKPMFEAIILGAIDVAYSCDTFFQTLNLLSDLSSQGHYEVAVSSYIHIYDVTGESSAFRINDMKFWLTFAFGLYNLREHHLYPSMPARFKAQIDNIIANLPNNCNYLFFRPNFCLMNKQYSEYIYITVASKTVDSNSRYVFGWYTKFTIDDMGPMKATILQNDPSSRNSTSIMVQLKGIRFPLYYYMMPQTQLVAAWELPSATVNSNWSFEFLDEDLVALYQQDSIACFTDEKYDSTRRYLKGYKSKDFSSQHNACQWYLGVCDRQ